MVGLLENESYNYNMLLALDPSKVLWHTKIRDDLCRIETDIPSIVRLRGIYLKLCDLYEEEFRHGSSAELENHMKEEWQKVERARKSAKSSIIQRYVKSDLLSYVEVEACVQALVGRAIKGGDLNKAKHYQGRLDAMHAGQVGDLSYLFNDTVR